MTIRHRGAIPHHLFLIRWNMKTTDSNTRCMIAMSFGCRYCSWKTVSAKTAGHCCLAPNFHPFPTPETGLGDKLHKTATGKYANQQSAFYFDCRFFKDVTSTVHTVLQVMFFKKQSGIDHYSRSLRYVRPLISHVMSFSGI